MNALALLTAFLPALIQAGQIVPQIWPQAGGAINALLTGVKPPAQQTNVVSLLQEALNALQTSGQISFDGGHGMGTPLTVDGHFGGRTFAVIKTLQAKFGIAVEEPVASYEYQMLQALFAKM